MRYLRESSWSEVKDEWKRAEDNQDWRDFYTKKGFQSWEDWRWARVKLLKLEEREWKLEEADNVIEEVRAMYCDASTRWTDFYTDREKSTFADLKDHEFFIKHKKVLSMRKGLHGESQIMGLRNQGKIIVLDGHHRSTAIAGMDESQDPQVNFVLGDISDQEFDKLYRGGARLKLERKVFDIAGSVRRRIKNI